MARWAAILLPFVFGARAILLFFQLGHEHRHREVASHPPAWPASAGEVLRFRSGDSGISAWAARPDHAPFAVELKSRTYVPVPPDTGCMLDPAAMGRHGGTMTFVSEDASHDWVATWSGGATLLSDDEVPEDVADPELRRRQAAMIAAADCGGTAQLLLTAQEANLLVNLAAGRPLPSPDPSQRRRLLHIRVDAPAP